MSQAPGISHLLFADDSLFFFKADPIQASRVREVLQMYSQGTGQLINPSKCSIYFGPVCDDDMKVQVMDTLQIVEQHFETKYLGLPTPEGRMTKGKFQSLQGKLAKRFMQVEENQMAQGGREVLIKAVGQSLATYVMGVYKLPFGLCDDMEKIIRNFWWGTEKGKRKMHWLAWDVMLKPKKQGGMGFKDMRMFNQALLARQAWRLIQFPDSLCAQILRAKYYPNGNLLDTVHRQRIIYMACHRIWARTLEKRSNLENR
jgi:hypothetical protein